MSVLFPFTLVQTRNVLSFYLCSFIHNMFSTSILWLAAIQIFLLMDGFEKLLVLFRLGWSEVTAIFELRCLVFIKFGKYMANIFTSTCFFYFLTPSGIINIVQLFPLPTFSQGSHSVSFLLSLFHFEVSIAITLNHFLLWYWVCHWYHSLYFSW